jgi:hypothetical protein
MIVLMALATALFFFFSSTFSPLMNAIGIALLICIAVSATVRPKSIFSLPSVDERKLVLAPDELVWGSLQVPGTSLRNTLDKLISWLKNYTGLLADDASGQRSALQRALTSSLLKRERCLSHSELSTLPVDLCKIQLLVIWKYLIFVWVVSGTVEYDLVLRLYLYCSYSPSVR